MGRQVHGQVNADWSHQQQETKESGSSGDVWKFSACLTLDAHRMPDDRLIGPLASVLGGHHSVRSR